MEPFISNGKIHYNRTVQERNDEIEAIELTPEQEKKAIWLMKQMVWYSNRREETSDFKAKNEELKIIKK